MWKPRRLKVFAAARRTSSRRCSYRALGSALAFARTVIGSPALPYAIHNLRVRHVKALDSRR
jgi:hypothetical protein